MLNINLIDSLSPLSSSFHGTDHSPGAVTLSCQPDSSFLSPKYLIAPLTLPFNCVLAFTAQQKGGQEGRQCSTKQVAERLKKECTVCQLLCGHAYAIAFIYAPDSKPTKKKVINDLRLWKTSTNTHKQQQFCGSLWLSIL